MEVKRNSTGDIDYNYYIYKFEDMISRYASMYTKGYDECEDLKQEIRIKIWTGTENKFSPERGDIEGYICGIIKLESLKHVLDKKKYAQKYFDDSLLSLEVLGSSACPSDNINLNSERDYEKFISEFVKFLNSFERDIFSVIERKHCFMVDSEHYKMLDVIKELQDMGIGLDQSALYTHINVISKKLYNFAKWKKLI